MEYKDYSYKLTNSICDEIADVIMEFCVAQKLSRQDALRHRISAEEALLYWINKGLEGNEVHLRMGRRFLEPFISLEMEGDSYDPYREDNDPGLYCGSILTYLRLAPEYSYNKDCNRLLFRLKKKRLGSIQLLALVIVFATLTGGLGMVILPDDIRHFLQSGIVEPVYNTFFNVLSCIAGPMIFLSVTWGIYGIGDASTLRRIGKKMIALYIAMTFISTAGGTLLFPLFGTEISSGVIHGVEGGSILELVLGFFPSTIIEPFATGNTLQIIFLAMVIGIALLFLGNKTSAVAVGIEQINYIVQFLMEFISRLVPFVIFLVIVNLIWSDKLNVFYNIWFLLLILVIALLVIGSLFLMSVALAYKVSPMKLLKKVCELFLLRLLLLHPQLPLPVT